MKRQLIIVAACILTFVVVSIAKAQTVEGLNITTSPYLINLLANPGSKVTTELKIHNNGSSSQKMKLGLMKFTASGELGKPQLLEKEPGDDYFEWITFSENSFTLAPNEWKTIKATIVVPKTAAFGYYYAVTFTQEGKTTSPNQPSTAFSGAAATLVLLDVKSPNEKRALELLSFETDKSFYEFLPATFSIRVKNTGNIHIVPHGNIFINAGGKKDIGIIDINNNAKGNVLPNSNRIFSTEWKDGFPVYIEKTDDGKVVSDSKGNPEHKLQWDFNQVSKLRFGHYTAHLLMIYDDGTKDVPLEGSVSFWVIPIRIILGGLFIGIFVLIGLQSTIRNIWRKLFGKKNL